MNLPKNWLQVLNMKTLNFFLRKVIIRLKQKRMSVLMYLYKKISKHIQFCLSKENFENQMELLCID